MPDRDGHIYDPRGLDVVEASHYCGLKPGSFRQAVEDGKISPPLEFGRLKIWDKKALDQALDQLSGLGANQQGGWGDVGQNALRRRQA